MIFKNFITLLTISLLLTGCVPMMMGSMMSGKCGGMMKMLNTKNMKCSGDEKEKLKFNHGKCARD
jgi:hypothetical protein